MFHSIVYLKKHFLCKNKCEKILWIKSVLSINESWAKSISLNIDSSFLVNLLYSNSYIISVKKAMIHPFLTCCHNQLTTRKM